ncbi:antitoxin VapB family protein [Candidatus Woesearchaeota archaeon]|nr:antitoxin VapB family protein [Candidatus Woesearchaeota archaeon]
MATKTITVTEDAYEALKSLKIASESFSETIRRLAGKSSLMEFAGILSNEQADELECNIKEARKIRNAAHQRRLKRIVEALEGK